VDQALDTFRLWDKRQEMIGKLSGGVRQLVALARAMAQDPQILFLDEPTTYLDLGHQYILMETLRNWQQRKNLTVIMVLHDLNIASQNSSRLLMLNHGMIYGVGKPEEILDINLLEKVYNVKPLIVQHPVTNFPQILLE